MLSGIFAILEQVFFQIKYDQHSFEIALDVQKFEPTELDVKLEGNRLVVSGKHEHRADEHGYVTREFHREFEIPEVNTLRK